MSKYIIELGDSAKKVVAIYLDEGAVWTGVQVVEDLEVLNSDYINEHYGSLQDEAYHRGLEEGKKATRGLVADASSAEYKRGLEDGKAQSERGCEGCRFEETICTACENCCNSHMNHWTAKDDEIKAGDIVYLSGDKYIVSYINDDGCADLIHIWSGSTCARVSPDCLTRTGKHYDIDKILEAMRT